VTKIVTKTGWMFYCAKIRERVNFWQHRKAGANHMERSVETDWKELTAELFRKFTAPPISEGGNTGCKASVEPTRLVGFLPVAQKSRQAITWHPVAGLLFVIVAGGACAGESLVCQQMQRALDARRVDKQPDQFVLPTRSREGRDIEYVDVDLDGDNRPDTLLQSCGSTSYGSCTLFVTLSSGGSFEYTDTPFFVTRLHTKYYALVGESLSEPRSAKRGKRRLVSLTKGGAKLACKHV
jgi:hypothetical protein